MYPEANLDNPTVVRILLAAGESFRDAGYQGATTKDIAARAGVSKSLLHYHFKNKEHILFELQALLFRSIADSVRRISLRGTPSLSSAFAALDELWRRMTEVKQYVPLVMDLWKLSMAQPALRAQQDALASETHGLLVAAMHQTLGPLVGRLAIPPERIAQLLLSALPGFAIRLAFDEGAARATFDDLKILLAHILLDKEPT